MKDLVHLEEDFRESGLEVEPLACERRSVCGMLYADNGCIVSISTGTHAKISFIVNVFESAVLTVPETKTEAMLLRALNKVLPAPPLVVEEAGQRNVPRRCILCTWARSYQRKRRQYAINIRRIRLGWPCYDRFKRDMLRSFQAGAATIVSSGSCTIWRMLRSH